MGGNNGVVSWNSIGRVEPGPESERLAADDEHELISRLRKGDSSAFHRLVDGYAPRLFALAYRLTGNRDDAQDVVQETLHGVWKSVASFRGESSLWTWMSKILVRQVARQRRDSGPLRMQRIDRADGEVELGGMPVSSPLTTGVDAKVDLRAALTKLTSEHRQIVVLRELEKMSYGEISKVMQIPLGTVESRLYRARAELRRLLKDWK